MSSVNERNKVGDEIRRLVCKKFDSGDPYGIIADALHLPYRTVQSIVAVYKKTGEADKSKNRHRRVVKLTDQLKSFVKEIFDDESTRTLRYVQGKISEEMGLNVSFRTIGRAINSFNYSLKRTSTIPVRRNELDVIEKRYHYAIRFSSFDEEKIYYLDEAGFQVSMRRKYGRSKRGEKAISIVPAIRTRNFSVSAAICKKSLFFYETMDRPYNSNDFGEYIDQFLDYLDREEEENRIIIMDNVPFHKASEIREKIESRSHRLEFLPPYSPFLNPIEEVFSKWKGIVKQNNCQTEDQLLDCIHNASEEIDESNCTEFFSI